jgi:two-component system KDP operon response regulator KdpE
MMDTRPHILLIEDDAAIRQVLQTSLEGRGYRLRTAPSGQEGLTLVNQVQPALLLLDLGLPDMDGLDVIRQLRQWSTLPIIVLSARDDEAQKVLALDLGADDYVTKPFGMEEVVARIRVALRHAARTSSPSSLLRTGQLELDLTAHRVRLAQCDVHVTPTEYKLLSVLMSNLGRVLTHGLLLRDVWGPGYEAETQLLRGFIAQVRQKIEPQPNQPCYLITEPGIGYRMLEHPVPYDPDSADVGGPT